MAINHDDENDNNFSHILVPFFNVSHSLSTKLHPATKTLEQTWTYLIPSARLGSAKAAPDKKDSKDLKCVAVAVDVLKQASAPGLEMAQDVCL